MQIAAALFKNWHKQLKPPSIFPLHRLAWYEDRYDTVVLANGDYLIRLHISKSFDLLRRRPLYFD